MSSIDIDRTFSVDKKQHRNDVLLKRREIERSKDLRCRKKRGEIERCYRAGASLENGFTIEIIDWYLDELSMNVVFVLNPFREFKCRLNRI